MTPFQRAKRIVSQGGGILMPVEVMDHEIRFSSELKLRDLIVKEIELAVEEARENDAWEAGTHDSS